jgi:hypothetical protein
MKLLLVLFLVAFTKSSFSQEEKSEEIIEKAPVKEDSPVKASVPEKKLFWTAVKNPIVITLDNAKDFTTHDNTPESALNYFFASHIRKDELWKTVVIREYWRGEEMDLKLKQYSNWTITRCNLVSKSEYAPGKFRVKVNLEITADGKTREWIGEAEMIVFNSAWLIINIPA